jgi:BirA family biotin operon repressor/biotin-[acetyl-CoA-carboxylase] ligase
VAALDLKAIENRLSTSFIGRRIVYRESLGSTQDLARDEAEAGVSEGTVVVADEQTAGRGRQGRSWVSPPATNLYFTVVLRPTVAHLTPLGMIVPVAVAEGIEEAVSLACGIKWPNDIVVGGRKISGVLIDSELDGNEVRYALVGIGINVNFDPRPFPEIAEIATSVLAQTGAPAARETIFAAVLNNLEARYRGPAEVFGVWKQRLTNLGQPVTVHDSEGVPIDGFAESVTEDGSLVLRLADGTLREFPSGRLSAP